MEEGSQKPRILIVDDDEEGNRLLRTVFENSGFEAMSAFDGLEGLYLATKHLPQVILTGIVMPRMSGLDMVRSLKQNIATAKIPILVYSHLGRQQDKEEAEKLGVREFIVRGLVPPNEIVERARKAIPHGKYFIEFDPQAGDARKLAEVFGFRPYFECPDGKRMKLKLELFDSSKDPIEFKAMFTCEEG